MAELVDFFLTFGWVQGKVFCFYKIIANGERMSRISYFSYLVFLLNALFKTQSSGGNTDLTVHYCYVHLIIFHVFYVVLSMVTCC